MRAGGAHERSVRRGILHGQEQMQPGVQAGQRDPAGRKGLGDGVRQRGAPGFVGHTLPREVAGEIPLGNKARQRLLLKAAHSAGIERIGPAPGGQQMLRQHHVRDADAGREAARAGGNIDHRPVRPGHALQTGQRAGVEAELGVVVVLNDVPRAGLLRCPVQKLSPAGGGHRDAGGELVAGCYIAQRRVRCSQRPHRKAPFVYRQPAAGHTAVFQHAAGAGVAGVFHGGGAGQQRGQQAEQIFQARAHHHLVRAAAHAPVLLQIGGQRLAQVFVTLGIAVA